MSAYTQFFTKALKKFGIKSINDITPAKKKEFFNYIDKNWKGKNENMYENMYDDSQKQLAISRIGMFEDNIKKSIKSIAIRDKKKATEIMRLYKKHIIEFKLGVQKVLN